jgi:hypothetical protein
MIHTYAARFMMVIMKEQLLSIGTAYKISIKYFHLDIDSFFIKTKLDVSCNTELHNMHGTKIFQD